MGGGACEQPPLFGYVSNASEKCVAGCCTPYGGADEPRCLCNDAKAHGPLCSLELRCSLLSKLEDSAAYSEDAPPGQRKAACVAREGPRAEDYEICVCEAIGAVAVFSNEIAPTTTLTTLYDAGVYEAWLREWDARMADGTRQASLWLLALFGLGR